MSIENWITGDKDDNKDRDKDKEPPPPPTDWDNQKGDYPKRNPS